MSHLGNKQVMAKNIRRFMEQSLVKPIDVCTALKIPMPTFSDWINAKTYPRIDKIELLANYFGIQKSDLVEEGQEQTPLANATPVDFDKLQRIPILGRIAAGMPIYAVENIEGYTYTDLNGGAEYFALRVSGDSMDAAGIKDGYIVIVRRQELVDNGQIAVVLIDGGEATLKRFSRQGDIITLMPQSTNPAHHPFIYNIRKTHVDILGLVVKVEFSPV